jgi:hypothetical protein
METLRHKLGRRVYTALHGSLTQNQKRQIIFIKLFVNQFFSRYPQVFSEKNQGASGGTIAVKFLISSII